MPMREWREKEGTKSSVYTSTLHVTISLSQEQAPSRLSPSRLSRRVEGHQEVEEGHGPGVSISGRSKTRERRGGGETQQRERQRPRPDPMVSLFQRSLDNNFLSPFTNNIGLSLRSMKDQVSKCSTTIESFEIFSKFEFLYHKGCVISNKNRHTESE